MSSPAADRPGSKLVDLEVKDARIIFTPIWDSLEEEVGRENLRFPKEIILLGGAPGAGKGTQTQFISEARGLTCPPIVISELLTTPEMEKIKAQGGMVGDKEVLTVLLRKLLDDDLSRRRHARRLSAHAGAGRVSEAARRQDQRAARRVRQHAAGDPLPPADDSRDGAVRQREHEHRAAARSRARDRRTQPKVAETGIGTPIELRATDLSEELVRRRYQVFKEQTWTALTSLRQLYHYHFVNAEGPIAEVQANILKELKYQSSLELDPRTFERLRALPLAEELVVHGRQELVKRLDSYELEHTELLRQIVELVSSKFMPIITRHALSGRAHVNSEDPDLQRAAGDPDADRHLLGARLSRGRSTSTIQEVPERVDLDDRRDQVPHEGRLPHPDHVRGLEDPPRLTS